MSSCRMQMFHGREKKAHRPDRLLHISCHSISTLADECQVSWHLSFEEEDGEGLGGGGLMFQRIADAVTPPKAERTSYVTLERRMQL